ncbi:MAG: threonine dehydratase [Gammaproteobacteria bacterium]|nr:threonine dehydratase [Gammaproteobacteria bacterium]
MLPVTYEDVSRARDRVYQYLRPTLLNEWPLLRQRLGFRYLLKHENHQPTGAFKVRGGINLVSRLSEQPAQQGIISCTTGNHGQSLAYAARQFGVGCTLVVPERNNPGKIQAMRALGAELVEHGKDFDEAKGYCEKLTQERGLRYVHSANEPMLIAGVGTMADEVFDREPAPDVIIVPIGLGSGICGTAVVAAERNPSTQVIGVQSAGAPAVTESYKTGKIVQYDSLDTIAEGLATRVPAEMTLDIMRRLVSDIVLVTDEEIKQAMAWLLETTHNLAEPAGAAATAAAWKLRDRFKGKTVAGILSGGNCDLRLLAEVCGQLGSE